MDQLMPGSRIVLATHNAGKAREIAALLNPYAIEVTTAAELQLPEPEETGATFEANAMLKAQAAAQATQLPALADDSGLAVDALNGDPGIHSARWAGEPRDFAVGMERVHEALLAAQAKPPWGARFICVLALAWPSGTEELFRGTVEGHCIWPPRGENGFGYDPMFVPESGTLTFGEMEPADKEAISHRQDAFEQLARTLSRAES